MDISGSGSRGKNEVCCGDFEVWGRNSRFVQLDPKLAEEIGDGGTGRRPPPLGQERVVVGAGGTELEDGGQMEKTVAGDDEGRNARDR